MALGLLGCEAQLPERALGGTPTDAESLPELASTGAQIAAWSIEDGWARSAPLTLPATRVGALVVLHAAGEVPRIEARGLDADGNPGPWRPLTASFVEADQAVVNVELGEVVASSELRVWLDDVPRIAVLTWTALVPPPAAAAAVSPSRAGGTVGVTTAPLRAELAAIGVRDRASWGARATRCTDRDAAKYRIAIHHTVTPSGGDIGARLRGIQAYHMDTQGWCDIGYHFLVSLDGTLWEGRDLELLGTHVASNNTGNVGISFIGCFQTSGCSDWTPFTPPDAMVDAGGRLAGEIARIFGIDVDAELRGHRAHAGASTSCPGDNLFSRLDRLREVARGSAGGPAYRAVYVAQSFPLASAPFELAPNAIVSGSLDLRNEGTEPWRPGSTFLGTTEPRDVASPLAAPDWLSPRRAATVASVTMPGEVGRFAFSVRAPGTPGDYPQYFNLVQEGVAWFSDPGQGGPPDAQLQIRVTVLDVPPIDAGTVVHDSGVIARDAGTTRDDASAPEHADAQAPFGDAGAGRGSLEGGCGCRAHGPRTGFSITLGVATALAAALGMRRRRRSV